MFGWFKQDNKTEDSGVKPEQAKRAGKPESASDEKPILIQRIEAAQDAATPATPIITVAPAPPVEENKPSGSTFQPPVAEKVSFRPSFPIHYAPSSIAETIEPVDPRHAGAPTTPITSGAASTPEGASGSPKSNFEKPVQSNSGGFFSSFAEPDAPLRPHSFIPRVEPLAFNKSPRVLITPEAYKRMLLYVEIANKEVGWMGTVSRLNTGDFLIEEVFLLDQDVTAVETELSSEGVEKLTLDLLDKGSDADIERVNKMRFWGHSHVRMGTSPSGTDESTMDRFGREGIPWYIRGIFNKLGRGSFTIYLYEQGYRISDAPWAVWDPEKQTIVLAGYAASRSGNTGAWGAWRRSESGEESRPNYGPATATNDQDRQRSYPKVLPLPRPLVPSEELRTEIKREFAAKVRERFMNFISWRQHGEGAYPGGYGNSPTYGSQSAESGTGSNSGTGFNSGTAAGAGNGGAGRYSGGYQPDSRYQQEQPHIIDDGDGMPGGPGEGYAAKQAEKRAEGKFVYKPANFETDPVSAFFEGVFSEIGSTFRGGIRWIGGCFLWVWSFFTWMGGLLDKLDQAPEKREDPRSWRDKPERKNGDDSENKGGPRLL